MTNIKEIFNENKGVFVIAIFTAVLVSVIAANPTPVYAGSEPFIGEIMFFAGNFAPRNWAFCDGQVISIASNNALFALYGTIYGGDGRTTFALPDMRGRITVHHGTGPGLDNVRIGDKFGTETVILSIANMPSHNHGLTALESMTLNSARTPGDATDPTGNSLGLSFARLYSTTAPAIPLHQNAFSITLDGTTDPTGSGIAHNNLPPYQTINCNIALTGIFPSRN